MDWQKFSINDPKRIPDIVNTIHDCWFDVDNILYNSKTSTLSIKFRYEAIGKSQLLEKKCFFKKWEIPIIECLLIFHHVKSYLINDTERVGLYNLIDLEYDSQLKQITVITGVPIHIKTIVQSFEISVEKTDKVVEVKTVTSIFDLRGVGNQA